MGDESKNWLFDVGCKTFLCFMWFWGWMFRVLDGCCWL